MLQWSRMRGKGPWGRGHEESAMRKEQWGRSNSEGTILKGGMRKVQYKKERMGMEQRGSWRMRKEQYLKEEWGRAIWKWKKEEEQYGSGRKRKNTMEVEEWVSSNILNVKYEGGEILKGEELARRNTEDQKWGRAIYGKGMNAKNEAGSVLKLRNEVSNIEG